MARFVGSAKAYSDSFGQSFMFYFNSDVLRLRFFSLKVGILLYK